jgi:hypothetical protein
MLGRGIPSKTEAGPSKRPAAVRSVNENAQLRDELFAKEYALDVNDHRPLWRCKLYTKRRISSSPFEATAQKRVTS